MSESEPAPVGRAVCRTRQRIRLSGGFRSPAHCILSDTVRQDYRAVYANARQRSSSSSEELGSADSEPRLFRAAEIDGGARAQSRESAACALGLQGTLHGSDVESRSLAAAGPAARAPQFLALISAQVPTEVKYTI